MSEADNDSYSSLGTLAAQMLGVQAILMQELVRSQVVDAQRLRTSLAGHWSPGVSGVFQSQWPSACGLKTQGKTDDSCQYRIH